MFSDSSSSPSLAILYASPSTYQNTVSGKKPKTKTKKDHINKISLNQRRNQKQKQKRSYLTRFLLIIICLWKNMNSLESSTCMNWEVRFFCLLYVLWFVPNVVLPILSNFSKRSCFTILYESSSSSVYPIINTFVRESKI